jgi:hypothetical protein
MDLKRETMTYCRGPALDTLIPERKNFQVTLNTGC